LPRDDRWKISAGRRKSTTTIQSSRLKGMQSFL
jgi:hypothetical protein